MGVEAKKGLAEVLGKAAQWLQTADDRILEYALETTDPDPNAQAPKIVDPQEKIKNFKSVVDLVPQQNAASFFKEWRTIAAESLDVVLDAGLTGQAIKNLAKQGNLIPRLRSLEQKAFQYDPKTKMAAIADEEAYLQLKNTLKFIERAAFRDSEFLKEIKNPEMERLAILVSPDLLPEQRGSIYRLESGETTYEALIVEHRPAFEQFLKDYDGSVLLFDHPYWKSNTLFSQYVLLKLGEPEILRADQKIARNFEKRDRELFGNYILPDKLRSIPKMTDRELFSHFSQLYAQIIQTKDPQVRKQQTVEIFAIFSEVGRRGMSLAWFESQNLEQMMKPLDVFRRLLTFGVVDQLRKLYLVGLRANNTASRLDNYEAKHGCLSAVKAIFRREIDKKGSSLKAVQANIFLNRFFSFHVSLAEAMKIPFRLQDLLDVAKELKQEVGLESWNSPVPLSWEDVQLLGEATIPISIYPRSPDEWDDELGISKKIDYKGVPLFDMIHQSADTATFSVVKPDGKSGAARSLFRDVQVGFKHSDGTPLPMYARLDILSHEAFHNLEGLRELGGIRNGAETMMVFRERGAYFFGAYVLEEYFKLRLKAHQRGEKIISEEEIDEIVSHIAHENVMGLVANRKIARFYPDFNLDDWRIEIPLLEERTMAKAGQKNRFGGDARNFYYYTDDLKSDGDQFYVEWALSHLDGADEDWIKDAAEKSKKLRGQLGSFPKEISERKLEKSLQGWVLRDLLVERGKRDFEEREKSRLMAEAGL